MFYDTIEDIIDSIVHTSDIIENAKPKVLPKRIVETINCYAYSLRIMYPGGEHTNWYNPGFTRCGNFYMLGDEKSLIKNVSIDLENLGIEHRIYKLSENVRLEDGEYLIKVFLSYDDYHFISYDSTNDIWFHKMGWYMEPKLIKPSKKEMKKNSKFGNEPETIGDYMPIGYFAVKEL